jgi:hypothetical protein
MNVMNVDKYTGLFGNLLRDARYHAVNIVSFGEEVVLEGLVDDYESKRRIEATLASAGLRTRNCLRVMPGLATATIPLSTSNPATLLDDAIVASGT